MAASCLLGLACNNCLAQSPTPKAPQPARSGQSKVVKPYVFNIPGLHYADDIPTNFPIPTYPSNVTSKHFLNTTTGSPSASANITTKDQVAVVYDWYKDACKREGWTYKTPSPNASTKLSKTGPLYMIDAKKERNQVYISCHPNKKAGGTTVTISWCKEKN
jgi:hypothetical protein